MPRHIHIVTQISNLIGVIDAPFRCIISNLAIKDFMLLFTRHEITSFIDFCSSFRIMCDTKKVVLIIKILFSSSMNIVCDDYFCMSIVCQSHDFLIIFCLFTVCVSLNLKIIVREQVLILLNQLDTSVVIIRSGQPTRQTSRQDNQIIRVFLSNILFCDTRTAVKAMKMTECRQAIDCLTTSFVFCDDNQVPVFTVLVLYFPILALVCLNTIKKFYIRILIF